MKRILVFLIFLSLTSLCFAETLDRLAVITARKRGPSIAGDIPSAEAQIRLSDGLSAEFGQDANVQIPVTARTEDYTVFSWYYSGNLYDGVTISFTFYPMYLLDELNSLNENMVFDENIVIPYEVSFDYSMTRIGNHSANINKSPTTARNVVAYWGESRKCYLSYADSIDLKVNGVSSGLSGNATVVRSSATFEVSANLSTNTVIYDSPTGGNVISKSDFINRFKDSEGNNVTVVADHWVRSGNVMVNVGIDDTGKNWTVNDTNGAKPEVQAGVYYANVKIEFTKD